VSRFGTADSRLTQARVLLADRGRPHHAPGLRADLAEHRDVRHDRLPAGAGAIGHPRAAASPVSAEQTPSRAGVAGVATTTPSASAISTNVTPDRLCTTSAIGTDWTTSSGRDGADNAWRRSVRAARLSAAERTRAPSVRRKSIWAWASETPPTPTSTTAMMPS
jgi:hypothetical protein